jgi:hypothetical protein
VVEVVRTTKKNAKDFLNDVPEDKVFWMNDGIVLRNLHDLSTVLADMGDDTFSYHVNKDKNDFKNWILDVVGDKKLAMSISRIKKRRIMLNRINKRVEQLTKLSNKK